jgi:hypothetical protein
MILEVEVLERYQITPAKLAAKLHRCKTMNASIQNWIQWPVLKPEMKF